ncbi:MAG: PilC/PilY family type IV pilus protein, partial [Betaproteobacteria bacterium]
MRNSRHPLRTSVAQRLLRASSLALGLLVGIGGNAAVTDIANAPLVTSPSVSVRPNVLFVLDDSGSMDSLYMPDVVNGFKNKYGFVSSQCNGVYYDPTLTYSPAVTAAGAFFANSTFTGAWNDGFKLSDGTSNLSSLFDAGDGSLAQAAYYYTYSGAQTTPVLKNYYSTASTFYKECNSSIGSAPGSAVFTKVVVSSTSGPGATDERKNFANWYSYYRTRMQMMKTSAGAAFSPIDDRYRVAYMTINNNVNPSWLNFAQFDSTQKAAWYAKLYGANPGNSTPLRESLSNAGRIYAGKKTSIYGVAVTDPIQYSCQQNFTILSTDGFWNGNAGFKLDGTTAVGNQDGSEARPFFDGGSPAKSKVVTTTVTNTVTTNTSTAGNTTTTLKRATQDTTAKTNWDRTRSTISAAPSCSVGSGSNPSSCVNDAGSGSARRTWCVTTDSTPTTGGGCSPVGAGGIFVCRGTSSSNSPGTGLACQIDTDGVRYCVYANNSTTGTSNCSAVSGATNSGGINLFVCQARVQPGYTTSTQPQRYVQSLVTRLTTDTDNPSTTTKTTTSTSTAKVTRVVTTVDGVDLSDVSTPSTSSTSPSTAGSVTTLGAITTVAGPATTTVSDNGAPTGTSTYANNGSASTSSCVAPPSSPPGTVTTTVATGTGVAPTVAAVVNSTISSTVVPVLITNTTVAAPTSTSSAVTTGIPAIAGTSDTLADVAEYYYVNDLRDASLSNATGALGTDVTQNNVPSTARDSASWQHMTTFTLGLGAPGRMVFSQTYETDTSGDFADVKNGALANPITGQCSWQAAGSTCGWPIPAADKPENIDDLWHAAVNGRGSYFSATNPAQTATGISTALAGVSARRGAAAAAATSSPNVTAGDNFVFRSTFQTVDWTGELTSSQIDLNTGAPSTATDWSARTRLEVNASRTLYVGNSSGAALRTFDWTNLTATERAYFQSVNIATLSQFCLIGTNCLSAADKLAAAGQPLVDFLRGDRSNEGASTDITKYFRTRAYLLGDIVAAEAVYVRIPTANYIDAGYAAFKATQSLTANIKATVYAASNDGYLHAFNAVDGEERWAYVPSFVLPNMYKLADKNYATLHTYLLDGTPSREDVYFGGAWHSILVGGQAAGGRGYYALDITDQANPILLWEFTNANLGLSFGNPKITKQADGTWVVLVASGYNNVVPGDGVGRLFVLNAGTGAIIRTISTGVGTITTPSGLAKIETFVNNTNTDNSALQVYGGDLLGNLWRFDINDNVGAAGYDAQRLVTFLNAASTPQPITAKPEVGLVSGETVVYVGTGLFL